VQLSLGPLNWKIIARLTLEVWMRVGVARMAVTRCAKWYHFPINPWVLQVLIYWSVGPACQPEKIIAWVMEYIILSGLY
jgi:hypothetical protein